MAERKEAKRGPRGTKAEIDHVKKTAEAAGQTLDREQEKSVVHLAQALEEINEGEALAHVDTRITFLERQVERLSSRRDEVDRSVQGELGIMRTRIEEALTAVGATAEETKDAWVSLEKRLTALIAQVERRSTSVVEAIRREVVTKVEGASTRLEKYEARLRGEMKTFEEESEERARSLGDSISESRRALEELLDTRLTELDNWVRDASGSFTQRLTEATSNFEKRLSEGTDSLEEMSERTVKLEQRLSRSLREFEEQSTRASAEFQKMIAEAKAIFDSEFAQANGAIDQRIARSMASVNEKVSRITGTIDDILAGATADLTQKLAAATEAAEQKLIATLDKRLESAQLDVQGLLENERREMEGRLSETVSEVRVETQRMRDAIESGHKKFEGAIESHKKDTLQRVRASEEKAAGAAIHLESMIIQQRRQMASDETEVSGRLKEAIHELTDLRNRVEEMAGRVSTLDARWATERGSSTVAFEGMTGRLDMLDETVREAVEELAAKQGTRLEMLASQVSNLSEAEVSAEERAGSVEYLKRRMSEMGERLEEIVVKVNALGRFVTKPLTAPAPTSGAIPAELTNRLALVEKKLSDAQPESSKELVGKIEELEKQLAEMSKAKQTPVGDVARLEAIEKRVADVAKVAEKKTETPPNGKRLEVIEKKLAEISKSATSNGDDNELSKQVVVLEKKLSELSKAGNGGAPAKDELSKQLSTLEKAVAKLSNNVESRQEQLSARVEELERRTPVAETILPQPKRGLWK